MLLTVVLLTFVGTTALYVLLFWLAARRITRHWNGDPAAAQAFSQYILVPLLDDHPDEAEEMPPLQRIERKKADSDATATEEDDVPFPPLSKPKKKNTL